MFGSFIAGFTLALIIFTVISVFFVGKNKYFNSEIKALMNNDARIYKIHIKSAFISLPFSLGELMIIIFTLDERKKMWLTLALVIVWGIALLIGVLSVIKKEKKELIKQGNHYKNLSAKM